MESPCGSRCKGPMVTGPGSGALVCTSCARVHDAGVDEFVHRATFTEWGKINTRADSVVLHISQSPYRDGKLYAASAVITSTAEHFSLSATLVGESSGWPNPPLIGTSPPRAPPSSPRSLPPASSSSRDPTAFRSPSPRPPRPRPAPRPRSLTSRPASPPDSPSLPPLPSFDYSAALERSMQCSESLSEAAGEKTEEILSQARFLLRCASKWSLTTGRHPLPLVAAVIAFAAELNGVTCVSVEEIALEISAVPYTSRRRYKELVAALVRVAQKLLPWGADVNARNLLLNAPMLLRLMEMRSQSDQSEQFLESFAPDIAGIVQVYSSVDEDESKYLQIVPLDVDDLNFKNSVQEGKESEDSKISEGCMSDTYQNVLKRIAQLKELGKVGQVASRRKRWKRGLELEPWMDSLGNDWTKNMPLEKVADIDIGYDAPPPSFTAGMELRKRRRARIEAAKCRIDEIKKAPAAPSANAIDSPPALGNEDVCPPQKDIWKKQGRKRRDDRDHILHRDHLAEISNAPDCVKKRRKRGACNGIDWEDCVIELLLLHGANEAEIEQGQYKRLLDLHVFSA